jgi:hypothetical protein
MDEYLSAYTIDSMFDVTEFAWEPADPSLTSLFRIRIAQRTFSEHSTFNGFVHKEKKGSPWLFFWCQCVEISDRLSVVWMIDHTSNNPLLDSV